MERDIELSLGLMDEDLALTEAKPDARNTNSSVVDKVKFEK